MSNSNQFLKLFATGKRTKFPTETKWYFQLYCNYVATILMWNANVQNRCKSFKQCQTLTRTLWKSKQIFIFLQLETEHLVYLTLCLSPFLTSIFPGGSGLDSTRFSPFWILLELRVMEVVVTTGAIRRAKFQSDCYQRTNQHPVYLPIASVSSSD